jgi:hypothetical protein
MTEPLKTYPRRPYDLDHAEAREPGKLGAVLREWGVAVVKNVFSLGECRSVMDQMVHALEVLSSGHFDHRRATETWDPSVLPPMVRSGLVQALMGNLSEVADMRSHPRCVHLFRVLHSELRGVAVDELVTSIDGINIRPPVEPFHDDRTEDWPHVDVSRKGCMFNCVQSQVVLNNTSAAFRCSPKSHTLYERLLSPEFGGHEQEGDWTRLQRSYKADFEAAVVAAGGKFQVPVHASAGDMIFWLSSTLHSAQVQRRGTKAWVCDPADPLKNWRAVVYVCLLPRADVDDRHIYRLHYAAANNRTTNHNGRRLFPLVPPTQAGVEFHPDIAELIEDPSKVYDRLPPTTNPAWIQLLGKPSVPAPVDYVPFLPASGGRRSRGGGGTRGARGSGGGTRGGGGARGGSLGAGGTRSSGGSVGAGARGRGGTRGGSVGARSGSAVAGAGRSGL